MEQWHRVFGRGDREPSPGDLLAHLNGLGFPITGHFRGDDQGWFSAELIGPGQPTLTLDRYLSTEEGIRAELNMWAAWLEALASGPDQVSLMERLIQTRQLFTFPLPPDAAGAELAVVLCRYLAEATDGVYQIDGRGLFAADGSLLVSEG
jgi:hypothetical protein